MNLLKAHALVGQHDNVVWAFLVDSFFLEWYIVENGELIMYMNADEFSKTVSREQFEANVNICKRYVKNLHILVPLRKDLLPWPT